MTTFSVEALGFERLAVSLAAAPEELRVAQKEAMTKAVLLVDAEVMARTPRKTGRLQSAWHGEVKMLGPEVRGIVQNVVRYGPFVENDTRAHDIVAHGQALKIPLKGSARLSGSLKSGGSFIFRKKVHHPGTKGKHMAREAAKVAAPKVVALFMSSASAVLRRIKGI